MTGQTGQHTGTPGLVTDVVVERGDFRLEAKCAVAPGQTLGIIGPNGAGKSTLLGAIAGSMQLSTGHISLADRTLAAAGERSSEINLPAWQRRIGHLGQKPRLFPHLDAAENIAFGLRARGMRRRPARRIAAEWLERVGLPGRDQDRPTAFSGGQQQRIALARALACQSDLVLLDEPFAALDVTSAASLRDLVTTELARLQVPALMVTHDPEDLRVVATQMLELRAGTVVGHTDHTPAEPLMLQATATEHGTTLHTDSALPGVVPGEEVTVLIDPSEIQVTRRDSFSTDLN